MCKGYRMLGYTVITESECFGFGFLPSSKCSTSCRATLQNDRLTERKTIYLKNTAHKKQLHHLLAVWYGGILPEESGVVFMMGGGGSE